MRARGYFIEGLLDLAKMGDRAARRSSWRQSVVSLGQATAQQGPGPLEGIDPTSLVPSVRAALTDGLIDDLDWLSPEAAAVALYEIASALPPGLEKREVGRRVAAFTYDGGIETFAAVATRMALGSGKGLAGPPIRARVALALELPASSSSRVDPLALALASRRDLFREWIARPSQGSLPARRLAGRLLERAAGEAARLAAQGDDYALRVFRGEALVKVYNELLSDRDPLVWKHVAIARGFLAGAMPELAQEIEDHLRPELSPTQWRRAATSLGASLATNPMRVGRRVDELLKGKIVQRDPGVAGCLVWGLAHGARVEPEAADEIVRSVVVRQGSSVAEAFVEAAREERGWLTSRACELVRRDLALHLAFLGRRAGIGSIALAEELLADLDPSRRVDRPVRQAVDEALAALAGQGARRAHELAQGALALARDQLAALQESSESALSEKQREVFAILRDLDISLLESAILPNLLALDRRPADPTQSVPAIDDLHVRLCKLFLAWEGSPLDGGALPLAEPAMRLRALRALIHLLDVDAEEVAEAGGRSVSVRERWLAACHTMLRRLVSERPSVYRRSLTAALARALEGLVRAEVCDPVDVLLYVASRLGDPELFTMLGEAAKHPDLIALVRSYDLFLRRDGDQTPAVISNPPASEHEFGPLSDSSSKLAVAPPDPLRRRLDALALLGTDLSGENSSREEALRAVLVRLSKALDRVHQAQSLSELVGSDAALVMVEDATAALAQLTIAARLRLFDQHDETEARPSVLSRGQTGNLSRDVERSLAGETVSLTDAVAELLSTFGDAVPAPIASVVAAALGRVPHLPREHVKIVELGVQHESPLPSWIPPRRTIGGFYVLRSIGKGGVGSVFVVKRIEERNDKRAQCFALKVPEFDAQAARHMSEAAFLQMFRNEATALLSLPTHPNLAKFETFDLGARPKPILVMELVDGVTLEMVIARRKLSTERALIILDGVMAGLEAMHGVGVAHLDIKPTNVVMRRDEQAVLVDFGLAGRHIRLGCGSGPYGSPEVWGLVIEGQSSPTPADVYATACLVYETLTTQPLFDQQTEVSLITAHMAHDGWPTPLRSWYAQRELAPLAQLMGSALRHDPADRIDITTFRKGLAALTPQLSWLPWPLSP